jgi:branched-chain amino acid transport system substrate-binding protein
MSSLAVVASFSLVAAACGGDDSESGGDTTTTAAATTTTAAATTTTAGGGGTTTTAGETSPDGMPKAECAGEPDTSLDGELGTGAGDIAQRLACALDKPLEAEGDPILIGFQNPKGDPAGSFPEYEAGITAAVKFINDKLGGVGSDPVAGTPGRPIELAICSMAINPADSQKCANELAGKKPLAVLSSLNFFGNHFPIYQAGGVPVFVGTPITIADFTTPGVYAIGNGGGCVGAHTGAIEYAVNTLGGRRVAVPWADTPPGVVCYHDLEKKPLNILKGVTPGSADIKTIPELEHMQVPVKPATPDLTPQVTQVLDFKPDVIVYSAQAADCWNMVGALGRAGWTNDKIPLVFTGSCLDLNKMKEIGEVANGITFISGPPISQPQLNTGLAKMESEAYVAAMKDAGLESETVRGFAGSGFTNLMLMYTIMNDLSAANGGTIDQAAFTKVVQETKGRHAYGGTPMGCAEAVEPYVSVCATRVSALQWTGEGFEVKRANFSGVYLVKGTPLDTGK